MSQQPKKLFKYHIDRNIENQKSQLQFFRRLNRWRFESASLSGTFKTARLRGPLIFAGITLVLYDQLFNWDKPDIFGLSFMQYMRDLTDHPEKRQELLK